MMWRQIEHHLFPAISFVHYPAIARIVEDECRRRGVRYVQHPHLFSILGQFLACLKALGSAPDALQQPADPAAGAVGGKVKAH
jgi:fatty acid desaturase (delta-4 desaturase)